MSNNYFNNTKTQPSHSYLCSVSPPSRYLIISRCKYDSNNFYMSRALVIASILFSKDTNEIVLRPKL